MEALKKYFLPSIVVFQLMILAGCTVPRGTSPESSSLATPGNTRQAAVISIVAAENFYGDIAKQLGGNRVSVKSILSDPNIDPHEYETNVQDAIAVSDANIVVKNGLGYDTWMDKLLSASPNPDRIVLTAGNIAPHLLAENPHVWYGIENIQAIAQSITDSMKKIDPTDSAIFDDNLSTFLNSLKPLLQKIADIKTKYNGIPIGLTETLYLYQTQLMGLNVLTPYEFEKAISAGNDPPADSIQITNDQISKKQVKVLIYNSQKVTPVTTNLLNAAKALNIPQIYVTETMPKNKTYQTWMMDQLNSLLNSLELVVQ